jgi:deaminated glutathione amidase
MGAKLAAVQMTSGNNVKENLVTAKKLIAEATATGAQLVVLPEMFATMGLDNVEKAKFRETAGSGEVQDFLRDAARENKIWLVGGTIPIAARQDSQRVRSACLILNDQGEEVARYDKVHLFDVHLRPSQEDYSESKSIEPGDKIVVVETPFGKLGVAVCYDLRFPELFRRMHAQDVEIIAVPTAFTYATGAAHWDILTRARAIENLAYLIAACQTGTHPNQRRTFGHSVMVNPWGDVVSELADGEGVISGEIDLEYLKQLRRDFPVLMHRKL